MAEVFYCDMCGARVTDGDLNSGRGIRIGTSCFCRKCAPKATEQLDNGQAVKSEKPIAKSEKHITKHTRVMPAPVPATPSRGTGLIIVVLALMGLAILVVVFFLPHMGENSGTGAPPIPAGGSSVKPSNSPTPSATAMPSMPAVPARPPLGEGRASAYPEKMANPPPPVTQPTATPTPVSTIPSPPPVAPPVSVATTSLVPLVGTGKVIYKCDFENGAKDWTRGKPTTEIVPPGSMQAFKADFFDNSAWSICTTYWQERLFSLGENTYFQFDYLAQSLDREDAKVLFGSDATHVIFPKHFSAVSDGKWHTQRFRINDSQPEDSPGKTVVPGLVIDGVKFFAGRPGRKDAVFVVDNIVVEDFPLLKSELLCSWDFENSTEGWLLDKNDENQPCTFATVVTLPDGNHVLKALEVSRDKWFARRLECSCWHCAPQRPRLFVSAKDVRVELDYYVAGVGGDEPFQVVLYGGLDKSDKHRYYPPSLVTGKWGHISASTGEFKTLGAKQPLAEGSTVKELQVWAGPADADVTMMIDNVKVVKGESISAASAGTATQTGKPAPEARPAPPPDPAKILYIEARSQYSQRLVQRDYAAAKALIEELLAEPKYAPAAAFLRSDLEDLALLKELLDRAAANAQKFVGKTIDAGGVSFKVVAVKGNDITTSVRGGQIVQPITKLNSEELLYLYNASPSPDQERATLCRMAFYLAEGKLSDARRMLLGQLKGAVAEKYAAKLQALSEGGPAP